MCQFSQLMGAPCQTIQVEYCCLVIGVVRPRALWSGSGTEAPNRLGSGPRIHRRAWENSCPDSMAWHARSEAL